MVCRQGEKKATAITATTAAATATATATATVTATTAAATATTAATTATARESQDDLRMRVIETANAPIFGIDTEGRVAWHAADFSGLLLEFAITAVVSLVAVSAVVLLVPVVPVVVIVAVSVVAVMAIIIDVADVACSCSCGSSYNRCSLAVFLYSSSM